MEVQSNQMVLGDYETLAGYRTGIKCVVVVLNIHTYTVLNVWCVSVCLSGLYSTQFSSAEGRCDNTPTGGYNLVNRGAISCDGGAFTYWDTTTFSNGDDGTTTPSVPAFTMRMPLFPLHLYFISITYEHENRSLMLTFC